MGLPWRWHIGRLIDILFDRVYGVRTVPGIPMDGSRDGYKPGESASNLQLKGNNSDANQGN